MISTTIIIPARYNSSRFPGKPLALLGNKTMLQTVYYNCLAVDLATKVIIATDDERIKAHCIAEEMDFIMTRKDHPSGTDRIAEAVELLNINTEYVINVQGDEPFIAAKELNILSNLLQSKNADIGSLYQKRSENFQDSEHDVKVVTTKKGKALYFSRAHIPFSHSDQPVERKVHIGVYGFKTSILKEISNLDPTPLEKSERLEQLRWLESGYEIYMAETDYNGFGIDTPDELEQAKKLLAL